jgi:hypothetical protein
MNTTCPNETQIDFLGFSTTEGATDVWTVTVKVHNGSGAARDYEFRLKRGGSDQFSCVGAVPVDNGAAFLAVHVTPGESETASMQLVQPAPSGIGDSYHLCGCTSNANGLQSIDWFRISLDEQLPSP